MLDVKDRFGSIPELGVVVLGFFLEEEDQSRVVLNEAVLAGTFGALSKQSWLFSLHAIIDYFSAIIDLQTRINRIRP